MDHPWAVPVDHPACCKCERCKGRLPYRLWVSEDRTVLVRMWPGGVVEVATREEPAATWGPPVMVREEYA